MAYGVVDIFNQACSSVTTTSSISSQDENSIEAAECRVWYETVRDAVLGSAFWPELTQTARLALLATRDQDEAWAVNDPLPAWTYAYAEPDDMLRPRYLASFAKFDMALRGEARSILTNESASLLIYTRRGVNPQLWNTQLRLTVVHMLASKIARKLTGSRSKMLDNFNLADQQILEARANSANMKQFNLDFTPSSIVARGGSSITSGMYVFPYADYSYLSGGNNG